MIMPLSAFEELRFAWELIAGNVIFLYPFARRKKHAIPIAAAGVVLLSLFVFVRFPLLELSGKAPLMVRSYAVASVYVLTALLQMAMSRACLELTISDALFFCSAGYASQHLVYVLVHEVLARVAFPWVPDCLPLYILVSILGCAAVYYPLYRIFAPELRKCGGRMQEDTPGHILSNAALLVLLILLTFSCQHVFEYSADAPIYGVVLGAMVSVLVLIILYLVLAAVRVSQQRAITDQMLRDAESHYTHSKELIEYLNRSVHDMKHTLSGLKLVAEEDRKHFIQETEAAIAEYQHLVYSENEVLNTILTEKALLCEQHMISFSVSMGKADLSRLSVPDLYVLLGNAVDNAVEGTGTVQEPEKRAISVSIRGQGGMTVIQIRNYFSGDLRMVDGLPLTSKKERFGHGYGLKSIRALAEKYGGSVRVAAEDQVFDLVILLPAAD